jgi:hypothetical protein
MEIEFSGNYDRSTFFQAVALLNRPTRRKTVNRIVILALFVLMYTAYFTILAPPEDPTTGLPRIIWHLVVALIVVYLLLLPYISAYREASRIWKYPTVRDPSSGFVTEQGITYNLASGQKTRPWVEFSKIKLTDSFIAMLTPDGTFSLLQRDFFKTDQDWQTISEFVKHSHAS